MGVLGTSHLPIVLIRIVCTGALGPLPKLSWRFQRVQGDGTPVSMEGGAQGRWWEQARQAVEGAAGRPHRALCMRTRGAVPALSPGPL